MKLFDDGVTLKVSTEENPDFIGVQTGRDLGDDADCPIRQIVDNPRAILNFGEDPNLPSFFPIVEKLGWPVVVEFRYRNLDALKVHAFIGSNIITISMPIPDKLARNGTTNFIQRGSSLDGNLSFETFDWNDDKNRSFVQPINAEISQIDDKTCHVHLNTDPFDDNTETRIGNLASIIRDIGNLKSALTEGLKNKNTLNVGQDIRIELHPGFTFRYIVQVTGACKECDQSVDPTCELFGCTNCQADFESRDGVTVVTIVDALSYMWCKDSTNNPCRCRVPE